MEKKEDDGEEGNASGEKCRITYLKGDATLPQAKGVKLIVHINNTYGGWGKGFASALTSRYGKEPARAFRRWHKERNTNHEFRLGAVQFLQLDNHIWLGNMVAQQGLGGKTARHKTKSRHPKTTTTKKKKKEEEEADPSVEGEGDEEEKDSSEGDTKKLDKAHGGANVKVQYGALGECLRVVRKKAIGLDASVHMPRIGTGLGGGKWDVIEELILQHLKGLAVFVYDK